MERIKTSPYTLLVLLISVIFFVIPFFWLKPGEMDLGGDSSRLYFYDPLNYLFSQSLFSVSRSSFGGESLSFFGIPFFLFLLFFKSIFHSPTILITAFHGFSLSVAFVACYLTVKELIVQEQGEKSSRSIVEYASIFAGLFYNLSPNPILGWGYVILTYNQVFLNPLMFFLFLRFFLTDNIRYILGALLVALIFSPNFSYIGAPSFFAFYPLAFTFLLCYVKFVRRKPIAFKKLAIGILLFILIQAYQLVPQVISVLTPGSFTYNTVFTEQGKLARRGYFLALAPSIKVSLSLLNVPQLIRISPFSWIFIVFSLICVAAFFWNRRKVYLLIGIFFLITLFFYSANITHIGYTLYVLAFQLPGFAMFRNFYGQWQWSYLFFYMLIVAFALFIVMEHVKKWYRYLIVGFLALLQVTTAWSFINGTLTDTTLWQSKDIKSHVEMDPQYEQVLSYIRSLPIDGKILTLPLDDHGYQVLKGKNDAAYVGPSTITYLTNKNEFKGFDEFGEFGPNFLELARDKNYEAFQDMLAMFNVKYIFYNSDPYIYGENFPAFPYRHVPKFLPQNQKEYKTFIENLDVEKKADFGTKYHIYEVKNAHYLPHLYTAQRLVYWNDFLVNLHTPLSFYPKDKREAFYYNTQISLDPKTFDDVLLKAQNKHQVFDFFKAKKYDKFVSPTVSHKLSSPMYPFVVLKEKMDLNRFSSVDDEYIDRSIYFAEKRINELVKWKEVPFLKNVKNITKLSHVWREPTILQLSKYDEYNSWEITLVRYQRAILKLINELEKPNQSGYSVATNKIDVKSYLNFHKDSLRKAIFENTATTTQEKKYLLGLVNDMFSDINSKLNIDLPDNWVMPYEIANPLIVGTYEVYIHRDEIKNSEVSLKVNQKQVLPKNSGDEEWIRFDNINVHNLSTLPLTLSVGKIPNLVEQLPWELSEKNETGKELTTLETSYSFLDNTGGLIREIPNWSKESIYTISFDYKTYDQNFLLTLYERIGIKNNLNLNNSYSERLQSKDWKKFKTVVLSAQDAQNAFLQITTYQDDFIGENVKKAKKIEIRNLSVIQVPNPQIVIKKVINPKEVAIPKITFRKVNLTKYKVTVQGAKEPYTLVLSEKFNSRWKLFLPSRENEAKTVKGWFSRIVGKILTIVMGAKDIVIESEASLPQLNSYFNNKITEGKHTNVFLDQTTFETFGHDPIVEKTHLLVNGYANGWYISPKDVGSREDYELIIEMTSQKLFYGSLLISIGGFLLLVIVFIKSFRRTNKTSI